MIYDELKRRVLLCLGFLIIILSIILPSGCIGSQKSNITIVIPENIETSVGKKDIFQVELLPTEADANDVVLNILVPNEISFEKYSKEFKTLVKGQKTIVPFNYTATSDGTFNLTFQIKAANSDTVNHTSTINAYVSVPKLKIGEFWIYNQIRGDNLGIHVKEVIRKDVIEDQDYYVIKETWEGDPNGTYKLSYYSVDNYSEIMAQFYQDDTLIKEKIEAYDPPKSDYGFPFKIGKKWSWSGSMAGIGKSEINSEIVKKENITVPSGTYSSYYSRMKTDLPMGTVTGDMWYVPELNEVAKIQIKINILGKINEASMELLEHGIPPLRPAQIQLDIKVPVGYKLYRNDQFNFIIAYPSDWKVDITNGPGYTYFAFMDSPMYEAFLTIESANKLNLTEYRDIRVNFMKRIAPGINIIEEKNITVNGRKGIELIWEYTAGGQKGEQVLFVVGDIGYDINEASLNELYDKYKPIFDNIVNSFFIKGSRNYFT